MLSKVNQRFPKRAYSYSGESGEFVGIVYADPDPLDVDNWLLPANSTLEVLDDAPTGYAVVYRGGKKETLIDRRGAAYYTPDGVKRFVVRLGDDFPVDALFEEPVIPLTYEKQADKANKQCSRRIDSKWNQVGQTNALFGIYGETEKQACFEWISAHRDALSALLSREDFLDVDVSNDSHWPRVDGA